MALPRLNRAHHRIRRTRIVITTSSVLAIAGVTVPIVVVPNPSSATTQQIKAPPPAEQEVQNLRTQYSNTYLEAGGQRKTVFSTVPVNYKDASGKWSAIDSSLVPTVSGGWHNAANDISIQLPASLSQPVILARGNDRIGFSLIGAQGTGRAAGSSVTYSNVLPSTNVEYQTSPVGVKETLKLADSGAPTSFSWTLNLGSSMTAFSSSEGVVIDASNRAVALMSAPTVSDAAGNAGTASLTLASDSSSVVLAVDPTWLASATFPVTIDPITSYLSTNDGCTLKQGSPNTAFCYTANLGVGHSGGNTQRAVVHWGAMSDGTIPVDAQVTSAVLSMPVVSLTGSVTVNAFPLSKAYSNSAVTWKKYDGVTNWTTAGGDFASSPTTSASVPSSGTFSMNIATSLAQSWVNGGSANNGLILKASTETGANLAQFDPENSFSDFLTVYWAENMGQASWYPTYSHQLDDHLGLSVNTANGNLVVHATQLNIRGTGLNEVADAFYNSADQGTYSPEGYGWTFGEGSGVVLGINYDNITIYLPGAQPAVFMDNGASWITPPGIDAILTKPSSGHYSLTFDQSQVVMKFTSQSACTNPLLPMTSLTNRNGETITYSYSTSCDPINGAFWSSATDTQGRATAVANNGSNYTGLTDPQTPTARTVGYGIGGYLSSQLQSITDTSANTTHFTYDASDSYMTEIEDPNGNYTKIAYDTSGRVHTLTYVTNTGTMTGPTYTFAYGTGSTCNGTSGLTSSTVTDPDSHTTTYCYNNQDESEVVLDGNGHSRSTSFNTDNQPTSLTDDMSTPQSTDLNYSGSPNNNLTSVVAAPSASGQTGATQSFSYNTTGSTGSAYLPSSTMDSQGNCGSTSYDPSGNLTAFSEGESSSCTGPADSASLGYQGDVGVTSCNGPAGVVCTSTDPDGHTTTYGYDGTTKGNLTSITPPSCSGCPGATAITYDSLSRVASVTDGKSQKTTYSYDAMDRVLQILYCGTGTCPSPSSTNSINYTYDADGNLKTQVDNTGTTTYYYDALRRITTISLPSGANACSGSSPLGTTYVFDDASNVTSSCDLAGTTTYTYDAANQLTSMTEPSGTSGCTVSPVHLTTGCTAFAYDNDGRRTTTQFPGGATEVVGYQNSGNISSIVGKNSSGTILTNLSYTYTSTTTDHNLLYQEVESAPSSVTTTYTYDTDNRLTSAAISGGTTYTYYYDAAGNRCSAAATGTPALCPTGTGVFAYNAANQLTGSPFGSSYSYDGNGNETAGYSTIGATSKAISESYNNRNQTSSITPSGSSAVNFAYTGADSTQRTASGSTSFANEEPSGSSSNQVQTDFSTVCYLYDPTGHLLGEHVTPTSYYYLHNVQGSIIAVITGNGGTVENKYSYDPYGNITSSSTSVANPWQYAGGYYDSSTGLIKFGTRYYNPTIGRWTQQEAKDGGITNPQALNRYVYAADNPINMTDPTGQSNTALEVIAVGFLVVGASLFFGGAALGFAGLFAAGSSLETGGILGVALGTASAGIGGIIGTIGSIF